MKQLYIWGKRGIALALALLLLLSCMKNGIAQLIFAVPDDGISVSTGSLLAENYALTDAQKALLQANFLKMEHYTYYVPTDADNLVQVDADRRIITAKAFHKAGFTWIPAEAMVKSSAADEKVVLHQEEDEYTGSFKMEGNTYTVSVTYVLHIFVEKAQQETLLNAGANMKFAWDQMDIIAKQRPSMEAFSKYLDKLMQLVNGIKLPWGGTVNYVDKHGAVRSLYNQKVANGGEIDLVKQIKAYNMALSKSQYLIENGAAFYATSVETMTHLKNLCADRGTIETMSSIVNSTTEDFNVDPKLIKAAFDDLEATYQCLQTATKPEWEILDADVVRTDLSGAEYRQLDDLLLNIEEQKPQVEIVENLKANATTIQVNLNRFNITVRYQAEVVDLNYVDAADLTVLESRHTAQMALDAGSSFEEVVAALIGHSAEENACAEWSDYQVGSDYYVRKVLGMEQGDTLQGDLALTVHFAPKTYTISGIAGIPTNVPYGYNITLPTHPGQEQVYDYYVNEVFYRQAATYRVTGNTIITQTEGTPWVDTNWGNCVSLHMSKEAAAIMKSPALLTKKLSLRKPTNQSVFLRNDGEKYIVTTVPATSGVASLQWVATEAWVVSETGKKAIENFTNGSGSFAVQAFDKVEVHYELRLNGSIEEAVLLELVNLPQVLTEHAVSQKAAMQQLAEKKNILGKFGTYAGLLRGLLKDERVGEASATALNTIIENCINQAAEEQRLFLYEYLLQYEEKGLSWYYTADHYEKFNKQFMLLREQLGIFVNETPLLLEIMKEYLDGIQPGAAEEYYGEIGNIRKALDEIVLLPPHGAILRDAQELEMDALVAALEAAVGKTSFYTEAPEIVMTEVREAVAPDKCSIILQVGVEGRESISVSVQYAIGHVLSEEDIAQLQKKLDAIIQQCNIQQAYYTYQGAAMPEVNTQLDRDIVLNYSWTLKTIPVYLEGEEAQFGSFTLARPYIVLPACKQTGFRYRYSIGRNVYESYDVSLSITLSREEMEFIRSGGKIKRELVDIARQDMLDLVVALNNDLAASGAISGSVFIPIEDAQGKISIILKISPQVGGFNSKNMLLSIAQTLMMYNKYPYVNLGDAPVRVDTEFHLQGILDAILNSGFNMNVLYDGISPDGTICNMEFAGHRVMEEYLQLDNGNSISNGDVFGAKLVQTSLSLASNATMEPSSVDLYITMTDDGSNAQEFKDIRLGVEQITKYVNVYLEGGSAKLELTLTEKTYQKFLTAMLLTNQTQLGSINQLDYGACVEYLYDLIEPLLKEDNITVETLENTANVNGQELELSAAQSILEYLQKLLRNLDKNVEYSNQHCVGSLYKSDATMDADAMLDALAVPAALRSMIAENGGQLNMTVGVQLTNVDGVYQALVIDKAKPSNEQVTFVTDVVKAVADANDGAVVILVDHVIAQIATDRMLYLDLNGKTIAGSVSGEYVILLDSTMENSGKVIGTLDASVQDRRISGLYRIAREKDSIRVYLNPAVFTEPNAHSMREVAVTLMMDMMFHFYTTSALSLQEEVIYQLDVQDLVAIVESGGRQEAIFPDAIQYKGFGAFYNQLIADLTDYTAMAQAMKTSRALASYCVDSKYWEFSVNYNEQEDILEGHFRPEQNQTTQALQLYVDGNPGDHVAIISLLEALGETLDTQVNVDLEQLRVEQNEVFLTGTGTVSATFLGGNNAQYALAWATLLTAQLDNKTQQIAALEDWLATEKAAGLKLILDNATVKQLIDALKLVRSDTQMDQYVTSLQLKSEYAEKLQLVMEKAKPLLVYLSNQLTQMQVEGNVEKLGAYECPNAYGIYDLKNALQASAQLEILGGKLPLDLQLHLELFNNDPIMETGAVQVVVDGSLILGSKIDVENKIIYLDTLDDGITVEQFNGQVLHSATNATMVKADFAESSDTQKGVVLRNGKYYVVNGAKVTFRASNDQSATVVQEEYTVILLGDVNSDGMVNVSDAVTLSNHIVGNLDLASLMGNEALLAANLDHSAIINISDVVRIAYKCVDNYTSILE